MAGLVFAEAIEVEANRLANLLEQLAFGGCRCNAARQRRYVGRKIGAGLLDDNGETCAHGKVTPACLAMLLSVPGASSSLGFPATVILPGLVRCLN